jgi:hypothetical protein
MIRKSGYRFSEKIMLKSLGHDRAESRSHRRLRRDAMVLSEAIDALYGMPRARIALREHSSIRHCRA